MDIVRDEQIEIVKQSVKFYYCYNIFSCVYTFNLLSLFFFFLNSEVNNHRHMWESFFFKYKIALKIINANSIKEFHSKIDIYDQVS